MRKKLKTLSPSEGNENKRKFEHKKRRVIAETIKHSQQLKKDSRYIIDVHLDGNVVKGLLDTETPLCVMGKRCREKMWKRKLVAIFTLHIIRCRRTPIPIVGKNKLNMKFRNITKRITFHLSQEWEKEVLEYIFGMSSICYQIHSQLQK